MRAAIDEILWFWRDEVGPARWYVRDAALDAEIRDRFSGQWEAARAGRLDRWQRCPEGALALLILLDQFPRNMFRDRAEAFATDIQARAIAKRAIAKGFDRAVAEPMRQFFYLPLMHSEGLADQERCVRLIKLRCPETGEENLHHACQHRDVIRRFGRFPWRNGVLGRAETAAEAAFRAGGGSEA